MKFIQIILLALLSLIYIKAKPPYNKGTLVGEFNNISYRFDRELSLVLDDDNYFEICNFSDNNGRFFGYGSWKIDNDLLILDYRHLYDWTSSRKTEENESHKKSDTLEIISDLALLYKGRQIFKDTNSSVTCEFFSADADKPQVYSNNAKCSLRLNPDKTFAMNDYGISYYGKWRFEDGIIIVNVDSISKLADAIEKIIGQMADPKDIVSDSILNVVSLKVISDSTLNNVDTFKLVGKRYLLRSNSRSLFRKVESK